MSFSVDWNPNAVKVLEKLPSELIKRILNKIDEVKEDPFRYLEHYEGGKLYKLRIGDYRALIDIDFENNILLIQIFDKRGRVYK